MEKLNRLIKVVYSAIDEVNEQLPNERRLEKSVETVIHGSASQLDSLGLINLIVALEEKLRDEFNTSLNLSEWILSGNNPPKTLGVLLHQILDCLEGESDA